MKRELLAFAERLILKLICLSRGHRRKPYGTRCWRCDSKVVEPLRVAALKMADRRTRQESK